MAKLSAHGATLIYKVRTADGFTYALRSDGKILAKYLPTDRYSIVATLWPDFPRPSALRRFVERRGHKIVE